MSKLLLLLLYTCIRFQLKKKAQLRRQQTSLLFRKIDTTEVRRQKLLIIAKTWRCELYFLQLNKWRKAGIDYQSYRRISQSGGNPHPKSVCIEKHVKKKPRKPHNDSLIFVVAFSFLLVTPETSLCVFK